jgi:oligopeptide/dipeptide ABC transporter ATP-binding protein
MIDTACISEAPAMQATAETVLAAHGLCVSFPDGHGGRIEAVRDLSLAVRAGEFVGLMGEPGCGKSTAAAAMLGAVRVPGRITGGQVRLLGRDIGAMSAEALRRMRGRDAAIIMQNPRYALHPMLTVGQQIVAACRAHSSMSRREARAHAITLLRMVGINDPARRVDALAHELSSGMAQRVLIAIALSGEPRLLIADEPTSGLDVTIQAQILDQMWDNCRRIGSAVLLVTQDLGIVANYCDRVLIMMNGTLVEQADAGRFFRAPQHAYSRAILALQRDAHASGAAAMPRAVEGAAPLLRIEGLTKLFPVRGSASKVHAVDGVDLEIGPGECVGLVGESGSGKTTVGRCLLRLQPPTAGAIRYRGTDLAAISDDAFRPYRRKLQIVFQDPLFSLDPRMTVSAAVREPLDLHTSLTRSQKAARVSELLRLVGLDDAARDSLPRELSAGQQQRASIARAIACDPEFIVLDEPTSALTPETTAEIVRLLVDLSARLGLAYLFISHDLTTIRYVCHRVVVMYLGQVVESGTVRQVFEDPKHPYSVTLLASHLFPDTSDRRVDRPVRTSLKGEIPSPLTESLPKGCYLAGRCPAQEPRCVAEKQPLRQLPDRRWVRCWKAA